MEKMKYVNIGDYNSIVIFPMIIEHSRFAHFNPRSAGFCYISTEKVECFGESISLGIKSDTKSDTKYATIQYCGIDALDNLINEKIEN